MKAMNSHLILKENEMNKTEKMGLEKDDFKDLNYNQKQRLGVLTEEDTEARKQEFLDNSTSEENTRTEANFHQSIIDKDAELVEDARAVAEENEIQFTEQEAEDIKLRFIKVKNKIVPTNVYPTILDFLKSTQKASVISAQEAIDHRKATKASLYQQMIHFAELGEQSEYRRVRELYATT